MKIEDARDVVKSYSSPAVLDGQVAPVDAAPDALSGPTTARL